MLLCWAAHLVRGHTHTHQTPIDRVKDSLLGCSTTARIHKPSQCKKESLHMSSDLQNTKKKGLQSDCIVCISLSFRESKGSFKNKDWQQWEA